MKSLSVVLAAVACAIAPGVSLGGDGLSVRVVAEGKFEERGISLWERSPGECRFSYLEKDGRTGVVSSGGLYAKVDAGAAAKLVPPTETGSREFAAEVEYLDVAPGALTLKYDSADGSFRPVKFTPGAWKPAKKVALTGDGRWKKAVLALPWARFERKGLNGADIRIDPEGECRGKVAYAALRLFAQAREAEAIDPADLTVLENEALRVEFDGLRIRRIYDRRRKLPVTDAASIAAPLLSILCKAPGDSPTTFLSATEARRTKPEVGGSAAEPTMTFTYEFENGVTATPRVKLTASGQLEFTVALACPAGVEVCELDYPRVQGVKLGGDPSDDLCYNGTDWRQIWTSSYRRAGGKHNSATRFMAFWDDAVGLGLSIEDPGQNDWWFWQNTDGAGGAQTGVNLHIRAKAGETWTGGGCLWRLAVVDGGDWHPAADVARAYNLRNLRAPDVHPSVKWLADAWTYPNSNLFPTRGWDTLNFTPHGDSDARSFGTNESWYAEIPFAAGNRQMLDGPCAAYCGMYPYPSLTWGSLREFREKLALFRALGGFYMPYFNFNLFSPGYLRHRRIGTFAKSLLPADEKVPDESWFHEVAAYGYDGRHDVSQLDTWFDEYPMAVVSPAWREWQRTWMRRYAEWGSDVMYLDQLNMAYPNGRLYPGYEDSYGSWLKASRDTVRDFKRETRAINPYAAYSGEVANEIVAQELDLSMTSGVFDHHEVFRYLNPWAICIDGAWNGGRWQKKFRFNWQSGARFEGGEVPKEYLALQAAVKCFLYDGVYNDTKGVVCRVDGRVVRDGYDVRGPGNLRYPYNDGVSARWFSYANGEERGAVVNVINVETRGAERKGGERRTVRVNVDTPDWADMTETPYGNVTVSVPTDGIGEVKAAYAFTLDGRVERAKVEGGRRRVRISVPECAASSIVLSNGRLRPCVAWKHDPVVTAGGRGRVELKVTNVNDAPMDVTVALRLPEGWRSAEGEGGRRPVRVLPGETKAVVAEYAVAPDAAEGRHDVWADVKARTGTFSAYGYAVVNPPFLMDLRGTRGAYRAWFRNLTDEPVCGTLSASGRDGLACRPASESVTIPPRRVVEVPVEVEGADALMEGGEIEATFRPGGPVPQKAVSRVKAVMPLLPNRNFEIDRAGDLKPDWWMCRAGMDWTYESMNLTTDAHSGRYALELTPPAKGEAKGLVATPNVFDAKERTNYVVSFWTKCDQPGNTVMFAETAIKVPQSADWVKTERKVWVRCLNWAYFRICFGNGRLLVDDIEIKEVP